MSGPGQKSRGGRRGNVFTVRITPEVFDPFDFGDPWSKRTALWGRFAAPERGPRVRAIDGGGPLCAVCHPDNPRVCSVSAHLAVTPTGFARAFFFANP